MSSVNGTRTMRYSYTHTHTHTHIYILTYMYENPQPLIHTIQKNQLEIDGIVKCNIQNNKDIGYSMVVQCLGLCAFTLGPEFNP